MLTRTALVALALVASSTSSHGQCRPARPVATLIGHDVTDADLSGAIVAIDGDIAVVSAQAHDAEGTDAGAVWIFQRSADGDDTWREIRKLAPPDLAPFDRFGTGLALDGDTLAVGAPGNDVPLTDTGVVYVFQRDQGGPNHWGVVKRITYDQQVAHYFGVVLSLSGDTLAVGTYGDNEMAPGAGAAYIFERDAGGPDNWGNVKKIFASDPDPDDSFCLVAIDGDTLAVGAYRDSEMDELAGAVYVFERDEGGTENWGEIKKITAPDADFEDQFGFTLDISGDTILVGAMWDDGGGTNAGAAYVYERDEGGPENWGLVEKLLSDAPDPHDFFGHSVAIEGDFAIVGAVWDDDYGSECGAAYLFERDPASGGWDQVGKNYVNADPWWNQYGWGVATDGESSVVGTPAANHHGPNSGAAYVLDHWLVREHCEGLPNSVGAGASLGLVGSTSIAADQATLVASGCPPHQTGLLLMGPARAPLPFGDGLLCVGAPLRRLGPPLQTAANGTWRRDVHYGALPGTIEPGALLGFQLWYRDPAAGTSNLSDGLEVIFAP